MEIIDNINHLLGDNLAIHLSRDKCRHSREGGNPD
jgi:uncharacterized Fe-S cluster protein YjdI